MARPGPSPPLGRRTGSRLPACLLSARYRHEGRARAGGRVDGAARDLTAVVDVLRHEEMPRIPGRQGVEVGHLAVLPDERAAVAGAARKADHLAAGVDAVGFAAHVSGQGSEV